MPNAQATSANWHYIDTNTGSVVAYSSTCAVAPSSATAYQGGALSLTTNRIYLAPYGQASQPNWHYINLDTGSVVSYAHGRTDIVTNAYLSGVTTSDDKIVLVPFAQSNQDNWHYIDPTGVVSAYDPSSGAAAGANGYAGGVAAADGRIYFIPNDQSNLTNWHYVQTNVIESLNKIVQTSPFYNKY
jgi:hypothetical protein